MYRAFKSGKKLTRARKSPDALPTVSFFIVTLSLVFTFCFIWGTVQAKAHTIWLETPVVSPPADEPLRIDLGFNEGFEVVEVISQGLGNYEDPYILGPEGEIKTKLAGGPNYEYVTVSPIKAGGYLGFIAYKPFEMGHGGGPKNRYFMTGKHVINVGKSSDGIITKPQGKSALEIVPLANPNTLRAGGSLKFQVLFEGKPLARATVLGDFRGFNPAGSWGLAKAFYCLTDKEGKVDFLPTKSGLWILKVRHPVPSPDTTEVAEIVHLSNITFFVSD
ncbi:MAG: DUF4198 domain-containing protein [Deltaproteobacteria bacterium]|jgi:uncharacterized GH25 family protein|nr:DUF4198 domain-containing protein [Deltaproteobacteria bacterium]